MSSVNEILDFWFGTSREDTAGKARKVWFTKDPGFDQTIQTTSWPTTRAAATSLSTGSSHPRPVSR